MIYTIMIHCILRRCFLLTICNLCAIPRTVVVTVLLIHCQCIPLRCGDTNTAPHANYLEKSTGIYLPGHLD